MLSDCCHGGAALRLHLTWEASPWIPSWLRVFTSHTPSPLISQLGLCGWIASYGPSALLQPGETPAGPGGELPTLQAFFPTCGITVGFCCCQPFLSTDSLFGEFPESILKDLELRVFACSPRSSSSVPPPPPPPFSLFSIFMQKESLRIKTTAGNIKQRRYFCLSLDRLAKS